MHLTRQEISAIFEKELGTGPTHEPEELTTIARKVLRQVHCTADLGISGANFSVAETGMISITENEGNARLTTALPKIHVAIMGIEKMLPKLSDLALFLPMLATAGRGRRCRCCRRTTSWWRGRRRWWAVCRRLTRPCTRSTGWGVIRACCRSSPARAARATSSASWCSAHTGRRGRTIFCVGTA